VRSHTESFLGRRVKTNPEDHKPAYSGIVKPLDKCFVP
jgi:hypothetical protein